MSLPDSAWEDWKKVLVTLPDSAFFTMAKHYLGELETPFTKQNIVRDLIAMATRMETQKSRRDLLSQEDLEILTAIHVLDNPGLDELATFLGRLPLSLRQALMNLEERLLVYQHPTRQGLGFHLTPVTMADPELLSLLKPTLLYPSIPTDPVGSPFPVLGEGLLLSLLCFLMEVPLEKSQTGAWKKKARQDFLGRFDALPEGFPDKALKVAENLGLLIWSENRTHLVFSYWDDLAKLQRHDRFALVAMGCGPWAHTALYEAARQFWVFYASLNPHRAYTKSTLVRLSGRIPGWGNAGHREALIEGWIGWGILHPGPEKDTWQPLAGLFDQLSHPAAGHILQSNFELTITQEVSFDQAYWPIQGSRLVRFDKRMHFEVNKASFKRALGRDTSWEKMAQGFEFLTGKPLTQNLRISFQEWDKEFASVKLWRGTIMTVAEDRRYLVEHTAHHQFSRELAPGVYLVNEALLADWSRELEQMGLPALPPVQEVNGSSEWGSPWTFSQWKTLPPPLETGKDEGNQAPKEDTALPFLKNLYEKLETLDRAEEEKEELRWRIKRRLILTERQLAHPLPRGERMEAKGLDYLGKLRLAEQALSSTADFLEIVTRDPEGKPRSYLIRPQKLEKQGGEILLWGEGIEPKGPFKAFISSLSLVKKIRGSLFH